MNEEMKLRILSSCLNKTYQDLTQIYGKPSIDSLLAEGLIANVNGVIMRTELGLNLSKPMGNPTNEQLGKDGYQLIVDANKYAGEGQLLHS